MNTHMLVILAIGLSIILALNPIKLISLTDASLFFTVIGVTYGVMSAFAINDVDKALDQLRDSFGHEVSALKAIYLLSKNLSDNKTIKKIKASTIEYCRDTIALELTAYSNAAKAHLKFHSLLGLIASLKIKNNRDKVLFNSIVEEAKTASKARDEQLILARDRLPKIQWVLELFLSLLLIIILTVVSIPQTTMAEVITFFMMLAILLTLIVIYELDSMRDFEDEISNEPYRKLIAVIEKDL